MAFDRAKVSLQAVEERLRRMFNLAGTIGATFEPTLAPIIIAGDLREAGLSSARGRHVAYCSGRVVTGGTPNAVYGVTFNVDTLIDAIFTTGLAPASSTTVHVATEDMAQALPVPGRAAVGAWVDNKRRNLDLAPFTDSGTVQQIAGAGAFALLNEQNRITAFDCNALGGQSDTHVYIPMMMGAGTQLWWTCDVLPNPAPIGVHFGFWGRIF